MPTSFAFSGSVLPPHDSICQIPIQSMPPKQHVMPASQHHNNLGCAHSLYSLALQQSVSNNRVVIAPDQPAPCKKRRADVVAISDDKRFRGCDRNQPIDISSDTSDSDSDDSESMGCRISVGRKHSRAKDFPDTYSGNAERYSFSHVCVSRPSHEANYISIEEDAYCSTENSKSMEPAGSPSISDSPSSHDSSSGVDCSRTAELEWLAIGGPSVVVDTQSLKKNLNSIVEHARTSMANLCADQSSENGGAASKCMPIPVTTPVVSPFHTVTEVAESVRDDPVVARVVVPPPLSGKTLFFPASARNCFISLRLYLTNISQTAQIRFLSW